MRKYAILKEPFSLGKYEDCVKVMIHETEFGVYVYLYTTTDEYQGNIFDEWYENLEIAEKYTEEYGVIETDWIELPDSLPDVFPNIIAPVRWKHDENGEPNKNEYEALVDGVWVDFTFD